jgi:serine/threonine protein kinase
MELLKLKRPIYIPTFRTTSVTVKETADAQPTRHDAFQAQGATYITIERLFHQPRSSVWLARELVPCPAYGEDIWTVSREVVIKESHMAVIEAEQGENPMGELAALLYLSESGHDHVIRVLNYFQSRGGHHFYVVLPYVAGGDLLDKMNDCYSRGLPEDLARGVTRQAVLALLYLKAKHLAHGDLSPENLALDAQGNVVLLDLGMCRIVPPGTTLLAPDPRGKDSYMALEVYKRQHFDPWAADVFSLGATLFTLLCQKPFWDTPEPYTAANVTAHLTNKERRRQVPLSAEAKDLLCAMLHPNPQQRPTLRDMLAHPWLQEHRDE